MNLSESRILVVEDDPAQQEQLVGFLRDLGSEVVAAADGREALRIIRATRLDLVLSDLRLPGLDGAGLLGEIRALNPEIGVVMMTAYGTVEGAVECMRNGARDYLLKPLDLDAVELTLGRVLEAVHLRRENRELRARLGAVESVPGIITAGGPMAEVLALARRVAETDVSLLIQGESGTGKEVLARAIHAAGRRARGPFVAVNAAAFSPTLLESELFGHEKGAYTGADQRRLGRFEAAQGGTLFLDEVGDLPPDIQLKLLRVLQERQIERVGGNAPIPLDLRLITATHRDLLAEVVAGRFREDFYYRIAVFTLEVPALRQRRADVPLLAEHFAERFAGIAGGEAKSFSREAMDLLVRYDYPGNIRELENIVQRSLVLARGTTIRSEDLPLALRAARGEGGAVAKPRTLPQRVAALERSAIEAALLKAQGNQSRAARDLGISERALRYKLRKIRGGEE
jgi:DNA-binding NtrC family response regulator